MLAYQIEVRGAWCIECRKFRHIQWELEPESNPVCDDCWRAKYKNLVQFPTSKKQPDKPVKTTKQKSSQKSKLDHSEDTIHIYNYIKNARDPVTVSQILRKLEHLKLRKTIYKELNLLEQEGKILSCRKHTKRFAIAERSRELEKYSNLKICQNDKKQEIIKLLKTTKKPLSVKIIQEETEFTKDCISNVLKFLIHERLVVCHTNKDKDRTTWYALTENQAAMASLYPNVKVEDQIIESLKEGKKYLAQISISLGRNPRSTAFLSKVLTAMVQSGVIVEERDRFLYYSLPNQ